MASPREENSAMVLSAGRRKPPAREQPCSLFPAMGVTRNALCGPGTNPAALSMEAPPAMNIWAVEEALGGVTLPFPPPLCRQGKVDHVLSQIQRGQQPHQERRRDSKKDVHGQPVFCGVSPERFLVKEGAASEGVLPGRGWFAVDGAGAGRKATGGDRTGGLGYGRDDVGWCGVMAGAEMAVGSPKSSVSSDESRGGMVERSPAAVWELGIPRGGGDEGDGERKRKSMDNTVAENGFGMQQSIDDLKKFLLSDSMEVESTRASAEEDIRKKEEKVLQLIQLLKMARSERDEARELLQELLNKIAQPTPPEHPPSLSYISPDNPSAELTRSNSSTTQFDALYFTRSHQLCSYSPVQPLSELVSATEFPSVSIADSINIAKQQQPLLPEYTRSRAMEFSTGTAKFDRASSIIDSLVMKKPLPEKGKLLQAMLEAGPLLQTLLVAGTLPEWRNPPPLKPFQIPPVSITACKPGTSDQNVILDSAKAFLYQNSVVASRIHHAASALKTSNLSALRMRSPMLPTCASSCKVPTGKKQKI